MRYSSFLVLLSMTCLNALGATLSPEEEAFFRSRGVSLADASRLLAQSRPAEDMAPPPYSNAPPESSSVDELRTKIMSLEATVGQQSEQIFELLSAFKGLREDTPQRAAAARTSSVSLGAVVTQQATEISELKKAIKAFQVQEEPFIPNPLDPIEQLVVQHMIHPGLKRADILEIIGNVQVIKSRMPQPLKYHGHPTDKRNADDAREQQKVTINSIAPLIRSWMDARSINHLYDLLWVSAVPYHDPPSFDQQRNVSQALACIMDLLDRPDQVYRMVHHGLNFCGYRDWALSYLQAFQKYKLIHHVNVTSSIIPEILHYLCVFYHTNRCEGRSIPSFESNLNRFIASGLPAHHIPAIISAFTHYPQKTCWEDFGLKL